LNSLFFPEPGIVELTARTAEPPEAAAGRITIQVSYCGLNFADVLALRGVAPYVLGWPHIPGYEVSGPVVAAGSRTRGFIPGDQVVALLPGAGGCAPYVTADADLCAKVPNDVSLALAATVPLAWSAAVGLVNRSGVTDTDSVIVSSAGGGVGLALGTALRGRARTLIGLVGSEHKRAAVERAGYQAVLLRDKGWPDRLPANLGPGAPDVIFESVGGPTLATCAELLGAGGRLVSYGSAGGDPEAPLPSPQRIRSLNQTIVGFSILGLAKKDPSGVRNLMVEAVELVRGDPSNLHPEVIQLRATVARLDLMDSGASVGKAVVQI